MKQQNIYHFSTLGGAKASIVERFNRTLKSKLYKYFTAANMLKYVVVLPKLMYQYNHTYHKSIRMSPAKVTSFNTKEVWYNLYGKYTKKKKKKSPAFKVGDKVRLNKNSDRSKKDTYLDGQKKCLWYVKWYLVWPLSPIKCNNLMTHLCRVRFMRGLYKKYTWMEHRI